MNDWLRGQIENGLPDLKGLHLKATLPLRDNVINDAIARCLQGTVIPTSSMGPDIRKLLAFVKRAQVRTTEGIVVIDLEISVE